MSIRLFTVVWLSACLVVAATTFTEPVPTNESAIAATVGDDPIEVAEAQRTTQTILRNKKLSGDLLAMAEAQVLEGIIDRRLVLAYARRLSDLPSAEALAKAKKDLQMGLAASGRTSSGTSTTTSISETDIARDAMWQLVWDRYLAKYITPQRREAWFRIHHADIDGTKLVVSHILLQPAAEAGPQEFEALAKKAESIRAEIISGKLDFAEAARKHSAGPSGKRGGRIGKISRHDPQDESFSRAAFQLKEGEISPPVRTPFGVDLIRCDEVVPGTKNVSDLTAAIDEALAKELLEKISQIERKRAMVKYSTAWPHFKPGTHELAK
jgi:parvulin-like peptidyl-prolyl isomerase